jgi:hypothetical protein
MQYDNEENEDDDEGFKDDDDEVRDVVGRASIGSSGQRCFSLKVTFTPTHRQLSIPPLALSYRGVMTRDDAPKVRNHKRRSCYLKQSLPRDVVLLRCRTASTSRERHVTCSAGGV